MVPPGQDIDQAKLILPSKLTQIRANLDRLAQQLDDGRPFVFGDAPCAADFSAFHPVMMMTIHERTARAARAVPQDRRLARTGPRNRPRQADTHGAGRRDRHRPGRDGRLPTRASPCSRTASSWAPRSSCCTTSTARATSPASSQRAGSTRSHSTPRRARGRRRGALPAQHLHGDRDGVAADSASSHSKSAKSGRRMTWWKRLADHGHRVGVPVGSRYQLLQPVTQTVPSIALAQRGLEGLGGAPPSERARDPGRLRRSAPGTPARNPPAFRRHR